MLRDYVAGADQMQDVLDQLFPVSTSFLNKAVCFKHCQREPHIWFDLIFQEAGQQAGAPPMPAESIQVF